MRICLSWWTIVGYIVASDFCWCNLVVTVFTNVITFNIAIFWKICAIGIRAGIIIWAFRMSAFGAWRQIWSSLGSVVEDLLAAFYKSKQHQLSLFLLQFCMQTRNFLLLLFFAHHQNFFLFSVTFFLFLFILGCFQSLFMSSLAKIYWWHIWIIVHLGIWRLVQWWSWMWNWKVWKTFHFFR